MTISLAIATKQMTSVDDSRQMKKGLMSSFSFHIMPRRIRIIIRNITAKAKVTKILKSLLS